MRKIVSRAAIVRTVAVISIVFCCCLPPGFSEASPQRQFEIGVGVHVNGEGPRASAAGNGITQLKVSFRTDIPWSGIETTKGVLQYPSGLKGLEDLVNIAVANHVRPVLILDYGNRFYDGGGQVTSAAGIQAFARYAVFVVNHFKGRVDQFEVWNEWNRGSGANSATVNKGDPIAYASLVRATFQAIKAENPNAVVIGGSIGVNETAWVEQFAAAGGLNYLDGFSAHPYVQCWAQRTPGPGNAMEPMANTAFGNVRGTPEFSMTMLDNLHATLQKYAGSRQVPIYLTEIGWPTSTSACGVPEDVAAAYLVRFYMLASVRSWVVGAWWYDLVDDGTDKSQDEHMFGLLTYDLQPKPAFAALEGIAAVANSASAFSTYSPTGRITVNGTTATGKKFYAAWLQSDNFSIQQPWPQAVDLVSGGMQPAALFKDETTLTGGGTVTAAPVLLMQQ